ncbi:MAG: hypothetical protein JW801_01725 [Bacteroidales bacterium]|nr:hypothetical protein [Bacteroidales bacterium]
MTLKKSSLIVYLIASYILGGVSLFAGVAVYVLQGYKFKNVRIERDVENPIYFKDITICSLEESADRSVLYFYKGKNLFLTIKADSTEVKSAMLQDPDAKLSLMLTFKDGIFYRGNFGVNNVPLSGVYYDQDASNWRSLWRNRKLDAEKNECYYDINIDGIDDTKKIYINRDEVLEYYIFYQHNWKLVKMCSDLSDAKINAEDDVAQYSFDMTTGEWTQR